LDTSAPSLSYQAFTDDRMLDLLVTGEDRLTRAVVDEFVAPGERMIEPLSRLHTPPCPADGGQDEPQAPRRSLLLGALKRGVEEHFVAVLVLVDGTHALAAPGGRAIRPPLGGHDALDRRVDGERLGQQIRAHDPVDPETAGILPEPAVGVDIPLVEGIHLDVAFDSLEIAPAPVSDAQDPVSVP
jgi:hypothetical protein